MGQFFQSFSQGFLESFKNVSSMSGQAQAASSVPVSQSAPAPPLVASPPNVSSPVVAPPVGSPPRHLSPTRSIPESQSLVEDEEKEEFMYRKERRRVWIETLPQCVPDFVPPPMEEPSNEGDKFFAESKTRSRRGYPPFPIQKGIPVQLRNRVDTHLRN